MSIASMVNSIQSIHTTKRTKQVLHNTKEATCKCTDANMNNDADMIQSKKTQNI